MPNNTNNKRIAQNTLFLYFRMILILAINLLTVRVILKVLGLEDYGIYNVIGGVVTLFSFLSGSLSSGTQRFLAYEIGRKDYEKLKKVFSIIVVIYISIAVIVLLLLEIIGYYFLNYKMNIPSERMIAANWVFQFSVITFLVNLLVIPYNAAIVAWEKMSFFAYVSIFEAISKLLCVFILLYTPYDRLILYSVSISLIAFSLFFIYYFYCRYKLIGCTFIKFYDSALCKEILIYSSWNMIGVIAQILRNQGVNIILNLFFSPIINAAHTIGQQVNGVVSQVINNVYISTRPQITKYYADKNKQEMWKLVFGSSKLAYYLLLLLCLPIFWGIDFLLSIWLDEVPPYTSMILRFLLLILLIETSVNQIMAVSQAANKLRRFQSYSSAILLLNVPISYLCLSFVSCVYIPYIVSIILSIIYVISLLLIARIEINLDIKYYIREIMRKMFLVSLISMTFPSVFYFYYPDSYLKTLLTMIISILSVLFTVWFVGLSLIEREYVIIFFNTGITRFCSKIINIRK
ncbi:MATE family efflux transporter [Parabacteroides goldsteinii]|uniref:lipopolysaccharide biosynthesis protein n=1 Tax=Parabacteroides goldsteinii TaxID=328812 RepID=UPI00189885E6|nr:lipopolysaccharide biosynthesis protein [Parabacteroides goldsteinii]